jgi:hypothetical protein
VPRGEKCHLHNYISPVKFVLYSYVDAWSTKRVTNEMALLAAPYDSTAQEAHQNTDNFTSQQERSNPALLFHGSFRPNPLVALHRSSISMRVVLR